MEIAIVWVLFGIAAVIVASQKNRSGCAWFALGFLLGPFGLLFALLATKVDTANPVALEGKDLPAKTAPTDEVSLDQETKKCPHCAETIKLEAQKCRYCGESFDPAQVDKDVATRRGALQEDMARLAEGQIRCPRCGQWDVYRAIVEDGGYGDWCPHCKKSVPK